MLFYALILYIVIYKTTRFIIANKAQNKDVLLKMIGFLVLECLFLVLGLSAIVFFIALSGSKDSNPIELTAVGLGMILCFVGSNRIGLYARKLRDTGRNPQTYI